MCDAPKKHDAPKESRECGDPSGDGAVAEASLGASDDIAGNHDEGVIVPKRNSEPSMSSVHVEPRCEPNVARDRPSVASVLLAISDRNRERTQESAAKKRANVKETEIQTMVKMLNESGREVADVTSVATESPAKRLRGKQAPAAAQPLKEPIKESTPGKSDKPPSCCVERSRSQVLFRNGKRGPGNSTAIPYGKGTKHDEHSALALAREWVIEAKRKRGMLP